MMDSRYGRRRRLGVTLILGLAIGGLAATHPVAGAAQDPAMQGPGSQELTAQQRARQALPADVYAQLEALGAEMEANGVPAEPLFNKALEGMAKRVPTDRLMPAIRNHAGRLREARLALGPTADVPLLVAGADALQRGVPADALRSLPSDRPRSPVALLVLAELLESGVPTDRALDAVRESMQRRDRDARILDIPARVRRMVRDGVPPHEAIDRVRRMLRRDRGGRIGPGVPIGDGVIGDRRIRDWRRPGG